MAGGCLRLNKSKIKIKNSHGQRWAFQLVKDILRRCLTNSRSRVRLMMEGTATRTSSHIIILIALKLYIYNIYKPLRGRCSSAHPISVISPGWESKIKDSSSNRSNFSGWNEFIRYWSIMGTCHSHHMIIQT